MIFQVQNDSYIYFKYNLNNLKFEKEQINPDVDKVNFKCL